MDGSLGRTYLKEYNLKTQGMFEGYLTSKIRDSGKVDKLAGELLSRYYETARLGKKIRGALIVLGYEIAGGKDYKDILDTSLFIEIFHAGVLIHDDVMDQDSVRRGLPSIHKQFEASGRSINVKTPPDKYGEFMAINVGDAAFYLSWDKLMKSRFDSKLLVEAAKLYSEWILRVVYGQALDITTTKLVKSKNEILKIHRYKAAEYTGELPLLIGAILGDLKSGERIAALREYGLSFGWAFQIQDDALGLFGDEEEIGKPLGSDIREGKNTLFIYYLNKNGTKSQKEFLGRVLGNKNITKEDVFKTREIVKESGAYDYVINLGWKFVKRGVKQIEKITDEKKHKDTLESLIVYMMERTS